MDGAFQKPTSRNGHNSQIGNTPTRAHFPYVSVFANLRDSSDPFDFRSILTPLSFVVRDEHPGLQAHAFTSLIHIAKRELIADRSAVSPLWAGHLFLHRSHWAPAPTPEAIALLDKKQSLGQLAEVLDICRFRSFNPGASRISRESAFSAGQLTLDLIKILQEH